MLRKTALVAAFLAIISSNGAADELDNSCPQPPDTEAEKQALAGNYFANGEQSFKDNQFDEALLRFICSLRLVPHQNTLFNIAHVTMLVDDMDRALILLGDYVHEHPEGEMVDEVEKIIIELEKVLGKKGSWDELPPEKDETADSSSSTKGDEEKLNRSLTIAGWAAVGLGGASFIVAAAFQGFSASAKDSALDATDYNSFVSQKDTSEKCQTGAIVGFVAAGVLGGAGLALILWTQKKEKQTQKGDGKVELSIVPSFPGLSVEGRF